MKKYLFLALATAIGAASLQAQRRVLYEEFTGENSAQSAMADPGLHSLISSNPAKAILLKYQAPLPDAGAINSQNTADVGARMTYYGVTFVPYGRIDGKVLGAGANAGNVSYLTQAAIDNEYAQPASFTISATHTWSPYGDSLYASITVTCTSSFAPAGAQMRLRTALAEHLTYRAAPPGTNGETDFPNVMRKMYPDAAGLTVPNSWTTGQSATYQISGPVPSYINKTNGVFLVVWLQNETDKVVAQAGTSAPVVIPLDAGSQFTRLPVSLFCTASNTPVNTNVTLSNDGTTALTSARVYYRLDNNVWQLYNWTGTVAPGGSALVSLPAIAATPGVHLITDSVAMPNNLYDINTGNSKSSAYVWVHNTTPVGLPMSATFENAGGLPLNWMLYDPNGNGQSWAVIKSATGSIGHSNSTYALYHNNYVFNDTEANYVIMPQVSLPAGARSLDFWIAYTQYQTRADSIAVVYSTNCGQTWNTVWSQGGPDMATAAQTSFSYFPAQADWKKRSIDISGIPNGALIAFKAVSNFGNNLFLDDVNMRTGSSSGVAGIIADSRVDLYPNPASDGAVLGFTLNERTAVQVMLSDAAGRILRIMASGEMNAGRQEMAIPLSGVSTGIYFIRVQTGSGSITERLSVIK